MKSKLVGYFAAVIVSIYIVTVVVAQTPPLYHLTDLGTLGGNRSEATAINASGQVVGDSATPNDATSHAFLYSDGTMIDLGSLGGKLGSDATGINASGQVVGVSFINSGDAHHAFLYSDGTMMDLGISLNSSSGAAGINTQGQVLVNTSTASTPVMTSAFVYSGGKSGKLTPLGTLGGTNSGASGINDSGQIVGDSITSNGFDHAFIYNNGVMTDLGTLGAKTSEAAGINASGQVVGTSVRSGDGLEHAFLYSGGRMADLGTLGGTFSQAFGVNASGQVVGLATTTGDATTDGFLYSGGKMYDLNNLLDSSGAGWTLSVGEAINDNGWIATYGVYGVGYPHAVLLTPELLRGDFSRDGRLASNDIAAMLNALTDLNAYKANEGLSDDDLRTIADINGDGLINNADVQTLLKELIAAATGGPGAAQSVPEPTALVLLAIGGLLMLRTYSMSGKDVST
jgi:probable HAF family extracellular repeat protein